jgi:hypothetical protein
MATSEVERLSVWTLWHVRAFNDSNHPIAGDADTWGACKRLKRRSKTMLSWDAVLHKLAAGSDGCMAFANDVSVESAFRTHGRRGRRLNSFHLHHASHCCLKVGMTHLQAFCAVS